ncbi:hypothetical protein LIN78_03845 [Leeia sp. TBRC 13508]|uniref:Uncharacterized protein n=1 Tax=Leeia speluncae TaxID=2884804 RepID=A0ABS8D3C2_9NEIS|nr:hypothetical protein [Leeia speluncae]MCB6182685.1 hypothetical protein [Leeia speluncae]
MDITTYLGKQVLGVMAAYRCDAMVIHICCVFPESDHRLKLFFPRGHDFQVGDLTTIHLDNRSGVDEFDSDIRVYRGSYKGRVLWAEGDWAIVEPRELMLLHGFRAVINYQAVGYEYPDDDRTEIPVPWTSLRDLPVFADKDHMNKVGVLITVAKQQPHTTVLAFLSSEADDIFLITFPETFKSKLLKRDTHCYFVMDERASFTFERAIEWNYTIIESEASLIPKGTALFEHVRQGFIEKNPWETPFFIREDLEMYHLKKKKLVCPSTLTPIA